MKKFLLTTTIALFATSGVSLGQDGTYSVTPEEQIRMQLQNNVSNEVTGSINSDGIRETQQRPARDVKEDLSGNVADSNPDFINRDCNEPTTKRPNVALSRDLADTEVDIVNECS